MKPRRGLADKACGALVLALLLLSAALATFPFARMFYDGPVNFNEGWNAYLQLRAASGEPLYSGYSPFFFCNYTPLSFYLIGGLGQLLGDVVLVGRMLSAASLLAIAAACAHIVRSQGGGLRESAVAVVASMLPFLIFYHTAVGANEPQMLGMAFAFWGLALHIGAPISPRRSTGVAVLLALALLIKQNLLALPVVVSVDMLLRADRRSQATFLGTLALIAAFSVMVLWWREGAAFYRQMLAPRTWSLSSATSMADLMAWRHLGGIAVVGCLLWSRQRADRLILACVILTFVMASLFGGGAGVSENIFYDWVIVLGLAAGLALLRLREKQMAVVWPIIAVLLVNGSALWRAPDALKAVRAQLAWRLSYQDRRFDEDVAYLRGRPGPVLCEQNLPCFKAGHAMAVDGFNTRQAVLSGRLPPVALNRLIDQGYFTTIMIYGLPDPAIGDTPNFDRGFFLALQRRYEKARDGSAMQFWVPKDEASHLRKSPISAKALP